MSLTAQKIKFALEDFFSKCDQIVSFLRIWLHLQKFLIKKINFYATLYSSLGLLLDLLEIIQVAFNNLQNIWH